MLDYETTLFRNNQSSYYNVEKIKLYSGLTSQQSKSNLKKTTSGQNVKAKASTYENMDLQNGEATNKPYENLEMGKGKLLR